MINKLLIFSLLVFEALTACQPDSRQSQLAENPNILWITCEDITPMLGTYGDPVALTPNLDKLAGEGIQYNHAYSTAAVCSPARSCLVTGVYATSLGTQNLRSDFNIPKKIRTLPHILREHGYYCTNNYKEDYNFFDSTIWDESSHQAHWRNRPDNKPFFSVFNIETTHQSQIFGDDESFYNKYGKLLTDEQRHNPDSIRLPSYYLDSPEVRKLWARYYDLVTIMDSQVAEILDQLKKDGLDDNTIVFFFSDHGTGMPRSKRALYSSGTQVPFLVYFPEKYKNLAPYEPGSHADEIVSFIDFPPTVLSLLGIQQPDYMQGKPFMGIYKTEARKYAFATADRVDEAFEIARTVKTKNFCYIRNFLPQLPLIQPNYYTDQSAISKELYRLKDIVSMTPAQKSMWLPRRKPEELYDLNADPDETMNLAEDPDYQDKLLEMRTSLKDWIRETHDTGLMPEGYMKDHTDSKTAYQIARDPEIYPVDKILSVNDMILKGPIDQSKLVDDLTSDTELVRYWAAVSLQYATNPDENTLQGLNKAISDPSVYVRLASADALCHFNHCSNDVQQVILKGLKSGNDMEVLMAARVFELHHNQAYDITGQVQQVREKLNEQTKNDWKGYLLYASWALNEAFR